MNERELPGGMALSGYAPFQDADWHTWMDPNLLKLSVMVQATALSRTTSLPGSPVDGQIYIVPDGDADEKKIAVRDASAWVLYDPFEGMRVYVTDTSELLIYDGAGWVVFAGGGSGIDVAEGGVAVGTGITSLNFTGSVSVSEAAGVVTVDVTGGGGGGGGTSVMVSTITQTTNSTIGSGGSTMGNRFTPLVAITVHGFSYMLRDAVVTDTYVGRVVSLDSSTGEILSILATSGSVSGMVDGDTPFFSFAAPVNLSAGTQYGFLITRTDGTGNEVIRLYSDGDPDIPPGRYDMPGRTTTGVRYATNAPVVTDTPSSIFSTASLSGSVVWSLSGFPA